MNYFKTCFFAVVLVNLHVTYCFSSEFQFLKAQGTQIVDEQGVPVLLRGVNLGGWLTEEMWMMPIETRGIIKDHVSFWAELGKRFSSKQVRALKAALRSNWITRNDFNQIAQDGFNIVRIPILYDVLEEVDGYEWLDHAIEWAKENNLYTIIDLHGLPGRQSREHHTGEADVNLFFKDCNYLRQAVQIWTRIAKRYRDMPHVVGYDLMNEPMGADSAEQVLYAQYQIYQAIRRVDSKHIIFIEDGYKGISHMVNPVWGCMENVVLSTHQYGFDSKTPEDHIAGLHNLINEVRLFQDKLQVPYFLGEFNLEPYGTVDVINQYIKLVESEQWGWALWTYKTISLEGSGPYSLWGVYRNVLPLIRLNPFEDSFDDLLFKINVLQTSRLDRFGALIANLII